MNRLTPFFLAVVTSCCVLMGWSAASASAVAPTAATCTSTPSGAPSIAVSKTADLDPNGQTVTVSGSGFDECKGIYVAFCVVPPAGQAPSPCGGGIDLTGANGSSSWISSNPPSYGVGLAVPYGPGGTFTTTVQVARSLSDTVDCTAVQCAVVTRNDHTRSTDRSQDVIVPVFFAAETASTVAPTPAPTEAPPEPTASPTAAPTVAPTAAPTVAPTTVASTTTAPAPVESATTLSPATTVAPSTSVATTTTSTSTTTSSSTTTSVVLITAAPAPDDDGGSGAQTAWVIGGATAVVVLGGAGTFSFLRRRGRL